MNGYSDTSKIVLGTVQFGLPYGISNTQGKVLHTEAAAILSLAHNSGINTLDTAIAYGESETTLGELNVTSWQVITKLPEMTVSGDAVTGWVEAQVNSSLNRLRTKSLYGLLLHRPAQLLGTDGKALYRALLAQREQGRVDRIGISVYGPEELDQLPASMKFDIVQAPLNILDTRMIRSGWVTKLKDAKCELHVRSIFLQGLLLMPSHTLPAYFSRWNALWQIWERWLQEVGLSPLQACVRYALHVPGVSKVVVGVNSAKHLTDILAATDGVVPSLPANFHSEDIALLNPALWSCK